MSKELSISRSVHFAPVLPAFLLLALLRASALAAPTEYQNAVLADNPYAYYRFGEASGTTALDYGPNGYNGTYVGSITQGVTGAGVASDSAVSFAQSNGSPTEYIDMNNGGTAFGLDLAESSYEFVFSTTFTDGYEALFGASNLKKQAARVALNINSAGITSANWISLTVKDTTGSGLTAAFYDPAVFDGQFHHLLFTYDGTLTGANAIAAYLDGVAQPLTVTGSLPAGGFTTFTLDPLFGASQSPLNLGFTGTIDEAAIYTTALSAAADQAHASTLGFVPAPEPGTVITFALGAGGLLGFQRRRRRPAGNAALAG